MYIYNDGSIDAGSRRQQADHGLHISPDGPDVSPQPGLAPQRNKITATQYICARHGQYPSLHMSFEILGVPIQYSKDAGIHRCGRAEQALPGPSALLTGRTVTFYTQKDTCHGTVGVGVTSIFLSPLTFGELYE